MVQVNREVRAVAAKRHGLKRGTELIDPTLPAPNFFIVGAAKAGTTSLHAYLSSHPQVFMSPVKEPHYFADFEASPEFDNLLPVIRSQVEYQELFRNSSGCIAVGEASPSYLCDAAAAERIRSAIPKAKIIVSLRNPIERAFSHYLMDFYEGRETLPFDRALQYDLQRPERGWGRSAQYTELGLYSDQVNSYLQQFSRDQVLVILFEDLVLNTKSTMEEVARFLGIDPQMFPDGAFSKAHNPFEASRGRIARAVLRMRPMRAWAKKWVPQSFRTMIRNRLLFAVRPKPKLDLATKQLLAEVFEEDLRKLEKLLHRDLQALRRVD